MLVFYLCDPFLWFWFVLSTNHCLLSSAQFLPFRFARFALRFNLGFRFCLVTEEHERMEWNGFCGSRVSTCPMHESVGSGGIHYAGKVCLYERVKYSMNLRVLCHGSTELGWIDICMITISHQLGSAKLIVTGATTRIQSVSLAHGIVSSWCLCPRSGRDNWCAHKSPWHWVYSRAMSTKLYHIKHSEWRAEYKRIQSN